jgi:hypothetical protein
MNDFVSQPPSKTVVTVKAAESRSPRAFRLLERLPTDPRKARAPRDSSQGRCKTCSFQFHREGVPHRFRFHPIARVIGPFPRQCFKHDFHIPAPVRVFNLFGRVGKARRETASCAIRPAQKRRRYQSSTYRQRGQRFRQILGGGKCASDKSEFWEANPESRICRCRSVKRQRSARSNQPAESIARRTEIWRGSFMASTRTVTRPTDVKGTITTPSHLKCSDHRSERGWNSRDSSPLCGSRPATLGPLCKLQQGRRAPNYLRSWHHRVDER